MKHFFTGIFLLLLIRPCLAQDVPNKELMQQVKKINILYPGFEHEKPIGLKASWGYSLGTRFWYSITRYDYIGSNQSSHWKLDYLNLVPSGELYGRYYYNISKRERKHKRIANNSASYFTTGAVVWVDGISIVGETLPEDDYIYSGVYLGWGMRRTFGSRIIFDMHLKVQPTFEDDQFGAVMVLPGIHIGYLLFE